MTTNIETRDRVYLAGLLHDIGKFHPDSYALWKGNRYFQQVSPEEQSYIDKANLWATRLDEQENANDSINQPLHNIFGEISINKMTDNPGHFGFHPLGLGAEVVLQKTPGNLAKLRSDFAADFGKLPTGTTAVFAGSLYHLLRQYTWCIPASAKTDYNTISLFHHLKLTGTFAQSLYDYDKDNDPNKSSLPLQLLCIDLSGIQSFIYNIGSKYAAKSLKGRSFSLQLLLDGIARKLIADTETTQSHLVYSSGGKFFMLLPHTSKINDVVKDAEDTIQRAVWEEYQGSLFVCFGRIPFDYEPDASEDNAINFGDKSAGLSELWKQVTQRAAEQKSHKNKALLLSENKFNDLFSASGKGGETGQCMVTGWEGKLEKTEDGTLIHQTVRQQIGIGKALADARFLIAGTGSFRLLPGVVSPFDLTDKQRTEFSDKAESVQILQPHSTSHFLQSASNPTLTRGFRFYGGSQQALSVHEKGLPKNFEELAGTVRTDPSKDDSPIWLEKCTGKYNRLAVLRMDVDSLSELFTKGLTGTKATFSAYATLSGLLDWFFSGYLNTIRADYADWVNIIYSGGDDVFAVGRWDKIIGFADQVQRDFRQFTGRPTLTISAGIVLIRPRYPIGKAADHAGEAEDLAKDHKYINHKKNAVSLFGLAVNWDSEWPFVQDYHRKFVQWLNDGTISSGILQKLLAYYDIYANGEAERKAAEKRNQNDYKPDLSWKWNAAYTLSRHRTDVNKDAIDELKQLLFIRINDKNVRFEALAMAMRWAELSVRDYPKTKPNDNGRNTDASN